MSRDAEQAIDMLVATCACPACERYRKAFARRAGMWAAKLEESFRAAARSGR